MCVCAEARKLKKKKKFQNWQLLKKVPELLHYWKRLWNSSGPENITGIKTIWFLEKKWQNFYIPEKVPELFSSWKVFSNSSLFLKKKKNLQNSSVPEKQLQNSYIPEKGSGTLQFLKKVPDHFSSQNSFQNSSVRLKKNKFWKSSFLKTFPKLCSYWKKFLEFFSFWKRFRICPGSEKLPEISGFWQMFWISQFLERKKTPQNILEIF